jgi:hypothetical protein
MEDDKEVSAMAAINELLFKLEPDAVARVLKWAADRYKVVLTNAAGRNIIGSRLNGLHDRTEAEGDAKGYEHFSDLYDAADPTTDSERVLVAGYWFQVLNDHAELDSHTLNYELKQTGHAVGHMPHALDDLMSSNPRLMIQLKKQGSTRQARRKFKLTTVGIKKVQQMISKLAE